MVIKIPNYRCPSINKTTYSHWRTYQKARDEMFLLVLGHSKAPQKPFETFGVHISAYYHGKRSVDVSNLPFKEIIDSLIHAKVIKDDDPTCHLYLSARVFAQSGKDELKIVVEELI